MERVLLDTNFLMIPGKFKVDVFHELAIDGYEPITLKNCVEELKKLAESSGARGGYAKIALEMLDKNRIPIKRVISSHAGGTDKVIIQYARENGCAVATNDRALIEGLKVYGVKIIRLRQGKTLVEE